MTGDARVRPDGSAAGGGAARTPWQDVLGPAARTAVGLVGVTDGAIAHLGDAVGETRALLAGTSVLVPLATQGALRLRGPDRIDFLNGQVSHDVRSLPTLGAIDAMVLDHRGRPQADVTVVRREDDLYVAVDDARGPHVLASLNAHLVFDQVEIVDLGERRSALVVSGRDAAVRVDEALGSGDAAASLAAGPGGVASAVPFAGGTVLLHARRRARVPSLDLHARTSDLAALVDALRGAGVEPVGEVALAAGRVDAGIAASAAEGADALPQEAGLDERISYRKGCYLGQEIMARIEARGSLRRGLVRLALTAGPADAAERTVTDADGKAVGRVGTAAWLPDGLWRALAVLRLDVPEGVPLRTLGTGARHAGALAPRSR